MVSFECVSIASPVEILTFQGIYHSVYVSFRKSKWSQLFLKFGK